GCLTLWRYISRFYELYLPSAGGVHAVFMGALPLIDLCLVLRLKLVQVIIVFVLQIVQALFMTLFATFIGCFDVTVQLLQTSMCRAQFVMSSFELIYSIRQRFALKFIPVAKLQSNSCTLILPSRRAGADAVIACPNVLDGKRLQAGNDLLTIFDQLIH